MPPTEAEIRAQMLRGSDMSIPLGQRPPMSLPAHDVEMCKDSQVVNPVSKAEVLAPGEGFLSVPSGAATLDRRSEIRVEKGVEVGVDAKGPEEVSSIKHVGGEGKPTASSNKEPTFAARPKPADPEMDIGAQAGVVEEYKDPYKEVIMAAAEEADNIRGVPAYKADSAKLSHSDKVSAERKAAEEIVEVRSAELSEEARVVEAPRSTATRPASSEDDLTKAVTEEVMAELKLRAREQAEQVAAVKGLKKQTVSLSSPTMGRVRAKVGMIAVSKTVVVLGYLDDDDTAIIEPPVSGSETVIEVGYGDHTFKCHYYGFTFEMMLPAFGDVPMLMVVLVRADG